MGMEKVATFAKVLEAADELSLDDQESLAEILHRRVVERRREELAREALEARQESAIPLPYEAGAPPNLSATSQCPPRCCTPARRRARIAGRPIR